MSSSDDGETATMEALIKQALIEQRDILQTNEPDTSRFGDKYLEWKNALAEVNDQIAAQGASGAGASASSAASSSTMQLVPLKKSIKSKSGRNRAKMKKKKQLEGESEGEGESEREGSDNFVPPKKRVRTQTTLHNVARLNPEHMVTPPPTKITSPFPKNYMDGKDTEVTLLDVKADSQKSAMKALKTEMNDYSTGSHGGASASS